MGRGPRRNLVWFHRPWCPECATDGGWRGWLAALAGWLASLTPRVFASLTLRVFASLTPRVLAALTLRVCGCSHARAWARPAAPLTPPATEQAANHPQPAMSPVYSATHVPGLYPPTYNPQPTNNQPQLGRQIFPNTVPREAPVTLGRFVATPLNVS